MPGPPPKRSDQRRRRNVPTAGDPTRAPKGTPRQRKAPAPKPDAKWHPVAKRWFNSLGRSGQSAFYEPSDWALAYLLAESMSRELSPVKVIVGERVLELTSPPKGATLAAWLKGMTALLVTEADRRRAALELGDPGGATTEEGDASVSSLDAWRSRTDGTG